MHVRSKSSVSIFAVLLLVVQSTNAADLIEGPEVALTTDDMDKILLTMPTEVRGNLMVNPIKMRKLIDQTYMSKVASHRARNSRLDEDQVMQAKIWQYEMNQLAIADVNMYVDNRMPDDDALEKASYERYVLQKNKFMTEDMREISHILFKENKGTSGDVSSKLEEIRSDIVSGKISFEDAAKRYSDDEGSAENNGALGLIKRGQMVKPFEEAAFLLSKPGDISDPIKTRYGYHLIKLIKTVPSRQREFSEVKQSIIEEVKKEARMRLREDYWISIRDDSRIRLNDEAINAYLAQ